MKKNIFLNLQIKRAFKLYPSILIVTVITLSAIIAACGFIVGKTLNSEDKKVLSVAVVGDVENTYFDIGIYALKHMDSSRFFIEIVDMEKEEANRALKNGDIKGYVIVPEGFVEEIQYGNNVPATFVTLKAPENIGSILVAESTDMISTLLSQTQTGIYSMQSVMRENGLSSDVWDATDKINLEYIDIVLDREKNYDIEFLGEEKNISMGGYYVGGLLVFFLLLWGISCNKLLSSKNISLCRSLNSVGIKSLRQIVCEYFAYLVITTLTMLIFAAIFGCVAQFVDLGIDELNDANILSSIGFVFAILPVIAMITMMQMALYELCSDTVGSVLMQFLIAVGLGYISGLFYPNYFFPTAVRVVADVLPVGVGFSYVKGILSGELQMVNILVVLVYITVFTMSAVLLRKRRMAGEGI